ncbi:MAG: glycosyltransferase [Terracidiphilus sp.]|nr:glycosyltransferase [Terracidiphilus sp.]
MENNIPGIEFHGFVFAPTGYGTAARSYIHAFHNAAIDLSVSNLSKSRQQTVTDPLVASCLNRHIDPVLHVCHAEPHCLEPLESVFSRLIALTTWEADALPQRHVDTLNQVLEVWVPCRYNFEAFRQQLKVPVFQIPHPVHSLCPPCFDRSAFNRELGLKEDDFVFVCVGTWQERKNLQGVIEAFLRAFPHEPNAVLIVKTSFVFSPEFVGRAQIRDAIARANPPNASEAMKRVKIFPRFWPDACMAALAQRADCYVSLHRGEGWCYPLFDAACNGTPVIATAYSGPMDYLDPRHHRLVRYELTHASQQSQTVRFSFTPDMSWATPDVSHAALLMRDVYDRRQEAIAQATEGAVLLNQKYSPDAIGRMAAQRLSVVAECNRVRKQYNY